MKLARWSAMLLLAVVLAAGMGFFTSKANAAGCPGIAGPGGPGIYGRLWGCSYFDNTYGMFPNQYNWLLIGMGKTPYDGLTSNWQTVPINYTSFTNSLHDRVFDPTSHINNARASAIIDVMLGKNGPDFGGTENNGIAYARAHWTDWTNLISRYASGTIPGYSVDFNEFFNYSSVNSNGWGLYDPNPTADFRCTVVKCYPDIIFSGFNDTTSDFSVVFRYPGGRFIIKDKCGNLSGDTGSLPFPDQNMSVSLSGIPASYLSPGGTYTISPSILNSGPGPSDNIYLELRTPTFVSNSGLTAATPPWGLGQGWTAGPFCPAGYPPGLYVSGSPPGKEVCQDKHWWWEFNGIPHSQSVTQTVTFTVSPATPTGGSLCFQADVEHRFSQDLTSYSTSNVVCMPVRAPTFPSVIGNNSDVNAAGGVCGASPNPGQITTQPSAASLSEYVVSSQGMISNFSSRDTAGSNKLSIGQTGNYSAVCHSDLYDVAKKAFPGSGLSALGPGTYDLTGWTDPITYINGTAHLCGTVSSKMTIVELNPAADLDFGGGGCTAAGKNTVLSYPTTASRQAPSLGIITGGNISIAPTTTSIDAYLFADGSIDTCDTSLGGTCNSTLTVNGFLMASSFVLHRLGPLDSPGAQPAEVFNYTPQIYLNPPAYFDAGSDTNLPNNLGESQPLF